MKCRHCGQELHLGFVDLGFSPPSNAYLLEADLAAPEIHYPLRVKVCEQCWLVQTEDFAKHDELFDAEYAYFSSTSTTWLAHARAYVDMIVPKLGLTSASRVVEIAANDGYLLQYVAERGIPCMGVEPTHRVAEAARAKGLHIDELFLGEESAAALSARDGVADLVVANNVLAHVPDINDFARGINILLAPHGTVTFEFPHLLNLIAQTQFDTIYHEHFSYLSLQSVERILHTAGLRVHDVEQVPTHGGSLRIYASKLEAGFAVSTAVTEIAATERAAGLDRPAVYQQFQARADAVRLGLQVFLLEQKRLGRTVYAYGAAAKGNTLLNYAGIDTLLIPQVADAAPSKQGKYLPGSHIPIVTPQELLARKPDFLLILPWNLQHEVMQQLEVIRQWGGHFVVAVPEVQIL